MKSPSPYKRDLTTWQREYIRDALRKNNGNPFQAAIELGLNPHYFTRKMRILGIRNDGGLR